MKASDLHEVLSEHSSVGPDQLNSIYSRLPDHASVAEYRDLLVENNMLKYSQIMDLFLNNSLTPRSNALMAKLAAERKKNKGAKKEKFNHELHLEEAQLMPVLKVANERVSIAIPQPTEAVLKLRNSDEKQAIVLALEMAQQGQPSETEIILHETIESFDDSSAAMTCLSWTYLACGYSELSRQWANQSLKCRKADNFTIELLALAELTAGKSLLACAHYQQLLRKEKINPLWYILLAVAQESTKCIADAAENYKMYLDIGKDKNIQKFVVTHLKELSHR